MSVWDDYNPANDQTTSTWGQSIDVGEGLCPADAKIEQAADGSHSFASVIGKGWHDLGTVFDTPQSAETLLTTANADYPVFMAPLYVTATDGSQVEMPGRKAICRTRPITGEIQPLGIGSDIYEPISNREAFIDFGNQVVQSTEPLAASCGVLYEGKRAFMCWRLPRDLMIGGVDAHEMWMTLMHSHDQSWPLTVTVGMIRSACANTCRYNLRNATHKWTIRKRAGAKLRLQEVRESLQMSWAYGDEWQHLADSLVNTKMPVNTFDAMITANFGPKVDPKDKKEPSKKALTQWDDKRGKLLGLFTTADTQENIRGTAYAALQAVGEYCDWHTTVRNSGAAKGFDSPEAFKFWRSWDDAVTVATPKQDMLRSVREYAGV
jgi:phage/plasmid-like protein (TIGR03299 family)